MYVDYHYYIDMYLMNRTPILSDEDFLFWIKQAKRELDHLTFDRIKEDESLINNDVKDCLCELAEYLFEQYRYTESISEDRTTGTLSSYSNDGESATYDVSAMKEKYSDSAKPSVTYSIVSKYLSRTGLMYRGL